MPTRRTHSRT